MISLRRLYQSVIAGTMAYIILAATTPDETLARWAGLLLGAIFYAMDPFGPSRGGFGTIGDDDFGIGG